MTAYPWTDAFRLPNTAPENAAPLPAYWECDLITGALRWSPGVYDLFGLPRDSMPERDTIAGMYVDDSREMLERLRDAAIAECGSFTFDAQIRRADGELRWMRLTADVITKDGRAVQLYGTKQDITDEVAER